MLSMTHVVGIDPGLVHTGVVSMVFIPADKELVVRHLVVDGPDPEAVKEWVANTHPNLKPFIFVERYVPRQRLSTDERMVKAEAAFVAGMPDARWIRNTDVKRVVSPELMQLLRVWQFPTVTHHQDLRSAARIGLYGMMKFTELNKILADFVAAHLDGNPWKVV